MPSPNAEDVLVFFAVMSAALSSVHFPRLANSMSGSRRQSSREGLALDGSRGGNRCRDARPNFRCVGLVITPIKVWQCGRASWSWWPQCCSSRRASPSWPSPRCWPTWCAVLPPPDTILLCRRGALAQAAHAECRRAVLPRRASNHWHLERAHRRDARPSGYS
jgi:hypothetical protein